MKHKMLIVVLASWLAAITLPMTPAFAATSLLNGQKQYYSVQLRNDKQAIVYGKIIFEAGSSDQDKIEFTLPKGVSVTNLSAQQILGKSKTKQCSVYETLEDWSKRQPARTSSTFAPPYEQSKQCLTYAEQAIDEDFDYVRNNSSGSDSYYSPGYYTYRSPEFAYKDITATQNGQKLTLVLPNSVKAHKQGAVLISYTSSDYVSGALGYFNYNFRTFGTSQVVDTARVAINFDEDLYSRQASQQRTTESTNDRIATTASNAEGPSYQSRSTDSTQLGIGRGGRYTKTQSNMLPGDILSVRGVYATNPILLYGKQFLIGAALLIAAVLAYVLFRRYRKSHPRVNKQSDDERVSVTESSSRKTIWRSATLTNLMAGPQRWSVVRSSLAGILATGFGVMAASLLFLPALDDYDSPEIIRGVFAILYIVSAGSILLFGLIIIPGISAAQQGLQHLRNWAIIHLATILVATLILWLLFSIFAGAFGGDDRGYDSPVDCINCGGF